MRERGLKQRHRGNRLGSGMVALRARAWIETLLAHALSQFLFVALRARAWIETFYQVNDESKQSGSLSVRERGLKPRQLLLDRPRERRRSPCESVD